MDEESGVNEILEGLLDRAIQFTGPEIDPGPEWQDPEVRGMVGRAMQAAQARYDDFFIRTIATLVREVTAAEEQARHALPKKFKRTLAVECREEARKAAMHVLRSEMGEMLSGLRQTALVEGMRRDRTENVQLLREVDQALADFGEQGQAAGCMVPSVPESSSAGVVDFLQRVARKLSDALESAWPNLLDKISRSK